jgi:hypothetical protein
MFNFLFAYAAYCQRVAVKKKQTKNRAKPGYIIAD